jgi:hypothetical protein
LTPDGTNFWLYMGQDGLFLQKKIKVD